MLTTATVRELKPREKMYEGAALVVERLVPKRGTFTLIMPDSMYFEVTEEGRTLRVSMDSPRRRSR